MRFFLDTEFIERGALHPIVPISIGIVSENGDEYYAEFSDVDWSMASDWVLANVKPHLRGYPKNKEEIAQEIIEFVGESPEFWAYYADYDWVLFCQLYGKMIDLPKTWPMFCLDIKQFMYHVGIERPEEMMVQNYQEHDALADAHWNRGAFLWLMNYSQMIQGE